MSMQDPIADLFTRIRNGQKAKKFSVICPKSKVKCSILDLLKRSDYITGYQDVVVKNLPFIEITLKYGQAGKPAISEIARISKPSLPIYSKFDDIPDVYGGWGIVMVSTSDGLYTKAELVAKAKKSAGKSSSTSKHGGKLIGMVV